MRPNPIVPTLTNRRTFWDRCFKDKTGHIVIGQKPNRLQIVGVVGLLVFWLADGRLSHIAGLVSYSAWATWAWLEVTSGVNYFRRACGFGVFAFLVAIALFA